LSPACASPRTRSRARLRAPLPMLAQSGRGVTVTGQAYPSRLLCRRRALLCICQEYLERAADFPSLSRISRMQAAPAAVAAGRQRSPPRWPRNAGSNGGRRDARSDARAGVARAARPG
jgi:hypothetical protein